MTDSSLNECFIEVPSVPHLSRAIVSLTQSWDELGMLDNQAEIKAHISNIRSTIEQTQRNIERLQALKMSLETQSQVLVEVIAPHRRIPDEILCEIFLAFVNLEKDLPSKPRHHDIKTLSLTCRRWCHVIRCEPRMWTRPYLTFGHTKIGSCWAAMAKSILDRAAHLPLDLFIVQQLDSDRHPGTPSQFNTLTPYMPQIHSLSFSLSFGLLGDEVQSPLDFSSCSSLRKVDLLCSRKGLRRFTFSWPTLTHLVLKGPRRTESFLMSSITELLLRCSNLVSVDIGFVNSRAPQPPSNSNLTVTTFNSLQYLRVSFGKSESFHPSVNYDPEDVDRFFQSFRFPALQNFSLHRVHHAPIMWDSAGILAFFSRSTETLTMLELTADIWTELPSILPLCPAVRSFKGTLVDPNQCDALFQELGSPASHSRGTVIFPVLKELDIEFSDDLDFVSQTQSFAHPVHPNFIDSKVLLDFLSARWWDEERKDQTFPRRTLRLESLHFSGIAIIYGDEGSMDACEALLKSCGEEGLDLQAEALHFWSRRVYVEEFDDDELEGE